MSEINRDLSGGFTGRIFKLEESLIEQSFAQLPGVEYAQTFSDSNWELYYFESALPMNAKDEKRYAKGEYDVGKKYLNEMLCCRAHNHFLLFTTGRRALTHLQDQILTPSAFNILLKPCYIAVDSFIKDTSNKNYILTSVSAFYNGGNDSLKSMLLYGDDIGSTSLFSQNLNYLNIYRSGVRDGSTQEEIISFSTDGYLYFKYTPSSMQKINALFKNLKLNGFLR